MSASSTSVPPEPSPGLAARLGQWSTRVGLGRKLAIALTVMAGASGLTTYAALSGSPPFGTDPRAILILLNVDLMLLLLLGTIVARGLVRVWMERRRGSAGSRLHTRFVLLFALVAVTPTIIVSVFSVVFFSLGVQAWFSDRVRTALTESLAVAESYLKEHRQAIRGDILAMARDLNRAAPFLVDNPKRFRRMVATQGSLRSLSEAAVFDSSGRVLARWNLGFVLNNDPVPAWALERAQQGETVLLTSESDDQIRAVVRLDRFFDGFLFVARFVEPKVLSHIERTRGAFREYQKLEGERFSFEITFAMMFVLVALLLLMAAIWVGLSFATRLARPISDLVGAAERVRAGDLEARVAEGHEEDEIGLLSRAFNRMTEQLTTQRSGLMEANRQLDERRHFIETVLSGVSSGVIGLDSGGCLNVANRTASELLSRDLDGRLGVPLGQAIPEMSDLYQRMQKRPARLLEAQISIRGSGGAPRTLLVRIAAENADGVLHGFVITFDDISELLSAQRKAAWSDVARRIAHEIKNPLTPIQLAAERLRRRYLSEVKSDPATFSAYTDTIIRQVADIGRLVDEFSDFARMPAPVLATQNLGAICRQAMLLQINAHRDIAFVQDFPAEAVELKCDNRQVGQALTNLLQNAVDAIAARHLEAGNDAPPGRIRMALRRDGGSVIIQVEDNGKGLPQDERDRLAEPYVTTREKGTGLGLAIVKKIMEDHGGELIIEDGEEGGARVRLVFDLAAAAEGSTAEGAKNEAQKDEAGEKAINGV